MEDPMVPSTARRVLSYDLLLEDWGPKLSCPYHFSVALALGPWWSYSSSAWDQAKLHGDRSVGARMVDFCCADMLLWPLVRRCIIPRPSLCRPRLPPPCLGRPSSYWSWRWLHCHKIESVAYNWLTRCFVSVVDNSHYRQDSKDFIAYLFQGTSDKFYFLS